MRSIRSFTSDLTSLLSFLQFLIHVFDYTIRFSNWTIASCASEFGNALTCDVMFTSSQWMATNPMSDSVAKSFLRVECSRIRTTSDQLPKITHVSHVTDIMRNCQRLYDNWWWWHRMKELWCHVGVNCKKIELPMEWLNEWMNENRRLLNLEERKDSRDNVFKDGFWHINLFSFENFTCSLSPAAPDLVFKRSVCCIRLSSLQHSISYDPSLGWYCPYVYSVVVRSFLQAPAEWFWCHSFSLSIKTSLYIQKLPSPVG